MRFKEFTPTRKTNEANPAIAAGAKAVAQGVKNVGNMAVQGIKNIGQTVAKSAQTPAQGQQPVKLKPGMKLLLPKPIGDTKIKSIQGNKAVLDTEKSPIGLDVTVDQDELLATLGQAPEQNTAPGTIGKAAQAVGKAVGSAVSGVKTGFQQGTMR